jgi:hypothetical protein
MIADHRAAADPLPSLARDLSAAPTPVAEPAAAGRARIPLWLKLAFTAFMAVLVPFYWKWYGPTNFLYFCDVAMFVTLIALWTESRFLVSLEAVAILLPQALWVVDFAVQGAGLLLHQNWQITGMTGYMFDAHKPLFVRGLSLFHGWLPFLLVYLLFKLGYDRRAFAAQVAIGVGLLIGCYLFTPKGPAPASNSSAAVNVNYVFGLDDNRPQAWMPPLAWLALLTVGFPLVIYWPTHWALTRVFRRPSRESHGITERPPT